MARCSDPFLNELKRFGYNPVLMPRAGIAPLELLMLVGDTLHPIGPLAGLLPPHGEVTLPEIKRNIKCLDIECRYTGRINAGLGLHILEGFLATRGVSSGALDAQYKRAKSLVFAFHNILQDKVELIQLDKCVSAADVNKDSPYVANLLMNDIYIITSVIKSQHISVEARDAAGSNLAIRADTLQHLVGVNATISAQNSASTNILYDNKVPLVFGFQAILLEYRQGFHLAYKRSVPSGYGMRSGGRNDARDSWLAPQYYLSESPFVRIK